MWACRLCEKETLYMSNFCDKCRRIKHLLNLYDDRVYEVLEAVLVRDKEQQEKKINKEIHQKKEDIENIIETRSKKK